VNEKTEHIDEDKTFLLTSVPAFKNLNHEQNYWAKMKMLGIMRKVNKYDVLATECTKLYGNAFFSTDV